MHANTDVTAAENSKSPEDTPVATTAGTADASSEHGCEPPNDRNPCDDVLTASTESSGGDESFSRATRYAEEARALEEPSAATGTHVRRDDAIEHSTAEKVAAHAAYGDG